MREEESSSVDKKKRKKKNESKTKKSGSKHKEKKSSKVSSEIKSPRDKQERTSDITRSKKRRSKSKRKKLRWKHLPDNVRYLIFSYFTLKDCATVTLVCKQWRHLFYESIPCIDFRSNFSRKRCTFFTNKTIQNVVLKFNNVQSVSFYGCSQVTNESVLLTCEHFQNSLIAIYLGENLLITDKSIDGICSISSLESLSIRSCDRISSKGIQNALGRLNNLQYLNLSYNEKVTDRTLIEIENLKHLKSLDLSCTSVCCDILMYVSPGLLDLTLSNCPKLDILKLGRVLSKFTNLKRLNISWVEDEEEDENSMEDISEEPVYSVNSIISQICSLPCIETLILRGNYISSRTVERIAEMRNLKVLDLAGSDDFSLDSVGCLSECPTLECLDLTSCIELCNDEALEFILLYLGHLQHVYLPTGEYFRDIVIEESEEHEQ